MTDYVAFLWLLFAYGVEAGGLLGCVFLGVMVCVTVFEIVSDVPTGIVSGGGGEYNDEQG